MGNAPSSAANPNPNTTSPGERAVNATPPRGGTRTGPTASSPLVGGSPGLANQSAPPKLKRAPSAVLTKPRPPLPNKSGPTNPPGKNTGSSARNIGPGIGGLGPIDELKRLPDIPMPGRLSGFPAVSQLDKDAATAIELQRQFEAEDTQRVGEQMQARNLAVTFFKCRICTEDQPEGSVARIEKCRHEFCRDCLRGYTTFKISGRCFPIVCPICATENGFNGRPDPGLVDGTIIQQIGISQNHYRIFQRLQMMSFFVTIHCRRCNQPMLINRKEFQETKQITCSLPECQYVWCKACQQPIKADGPKHSCSRGQENSRISVGDFSNSIEENQVKMFDPPVFSPSTRTAPNPFAPTGPNPFRQVSQHDRDAAVAVELQRRFEAEDQQLRAQRQALQRLALARGFRCSICMEVNLGDSVARIEKCRHEFCRDCLRDYTTSKISERCFPIVCPVYATEKGRPDHGLVDETIIQQLGISNNHYQIFEELQTISFSVPVHCRRCEQTMLIDREEFQETKEITCPLPGCQYVWCKACQQPIKDDGPKHSCDGANELQYLIQQQGWKVCPGCQTPVQKIDGCNHISCITPGCNSHFCYVDGTMILKGGTQDQLQNAKIEHYRKCKLFDYN